MAENLQGGHERAFAAVVGTDQHRQTIGRFDDRVPMRHKVNEFNPFNHWGAAIAAFRKSPLTVSELTCLVKLATAAPIISILGQNRTQGTETLESWLFL